MRPFASPFRLRLALPLALLRCAFACGVLGALLAAPAAAQGSSGGDRLASLIEEELDGRNLTGARWGVLVVDLESGRTLYERAADDYFSPASNTKLVTTAAALHLLGPDFRYETSLWSSGAVVEG
ncbi:MAG TPA: D-alanyl-D-alanine carboxypeptidase, partial [Rhodothermales bacterium]|nr:D-alanyl-D-alanine carboxypeptidase [Rhodothermales bacterium]